jgi:predicted nucleotidyltransferase component of viral defense system
MYSLPDIKNSDQLFYFLIHSISEEFEDHAILKGGMVLRLFGSRRETFDLDFVFVPFDSKKDLSLLIKKFFKSIEGLNSKVTVNSKMIRVLVSVGDIKSQIEINVASDIKTDVVSTVALKDSKSTIVPKVIKIMSLDVALAHKLAAWNERRLIRDLYDVVYLFDVQNINPDKETLLRRLEAVESRIPALRKIKKMSLKDFILNLKEEVRALTQKKVEDELSALLDENEIAGLSMRILDSIHRIILTLEE